MHRRDFIQRSALAGAGLLLTARAWAIPPAAGSRPVRFGFITDLHHLQFGAKDDEVPRLKSFMDAVLANRPDFIVQNGDFCRPQGGADIMAEWNRFPGPKYHVLGNHDMDTCDKAAIMQLWGMERPYYSFDRGGYHFVVMDRNFIKRDDGTYADYAKGNWYHAPSPQISFSDPAQLAWLRQDLAATAKPVVVFMHQPVFISDSFTGISNAKDILAIFDEANFAATQAGTGPRVAAVFMGHDHDDRYGERNGVHYFMINSASYAYNSSGAHYYRDSLFAFVTLDPVGRLTIAGRASAYRDTAPAATQAVFPAKISDHDIRLL